MGTVYKVLTRMMVMINSCLSVIGATDLDWLYRPDMDSRGLKRSSTKTGSLKAKSAAMYIWV